MTAHHLLGEPPTQEAAPHSGQEQGAGALSGISNDSVPATGIVVDASAVLDHLEWWFEAVDEAGIIGLSAWSDGGPKTGQHTFARTPLDAAAMIGDFEPDVSVYVRQTTLAEQPNKGRGTRDATLEVPGLWLDVDYEKPGHHASATGLPTIEQALAVMTERPGLAPSAIVHSGGGFYPLFRFRTPLNRDDGKLVLARWGEAWGRVFNAKGFHLDSVSNLDRILRPVGGINLKAEPTPVTWQLDPKDGAGDQDAESLVLAVEQWADELDPPSMSAPLTPTKPASSPMRAGTNHSVADQFQAMFGLEDVLGADGRQWDRAGAEGDLELWKFVDSHNDVSMKFDARRQVAIVQSESLASSLGCEAGGRGYSLWHFHCMLQGEDRGSYAADALRATATSGAPGRSFDSLVERVIGSIRKAKEAQSPVPSIPLAERGQGDSTSSLAERGLLLPDSFWMSRDSLADVRTYAHSCGAGADVTLACILTRIAANTHPSIVVKANAKGAVSLNFATAIIAPSGVGKTSAMTAARHAVPKTHHLDVDNAGPASGQGMIEAYMTSRTEPYEDENGGKQRRVVREQGKGSVHFVADEGESVVKKGGQDNATLWTTIRSLWSGQPDGDTTATADRTRHVDEHSYRWTMILGFQESKADVILEDQSGGTPQRFLWVRGEDPSLPYDPPQSSGVGWLPRGQNDFNGLERIDQGGKTLYSLRFPEDIGKRLLHEAIDRQRGGAPSDFDSQRPAMAIKLAGLLCLLDRRCDISDEDWVLANVMLDTSAAVRDQAIFAKAARKRANDRQRDRDEALHLENVESDREDLQLAEVRAAAATVARKVHSSGAGKTFTPNALGKLNSRKRALFEIDGGGLELCLDLGWLAELDELSKAGTRQFAAGHSAPPDS